jgi:hypothetical protein
MKNILYFLYISYLVDIVILFNLFTGDLITIFCIYSKSYGPLYCRQTSYDMSHMTTILPE